MPQKSIPSTTLAAAVREYLGLSQAQLATYLGVSRGQVAHLEAGRRQLRAGPGRLLRELAAPLPPPLGPATTSAPGARPAAQPPTAAVLRRHLAKCAWQLANLRLQLAQLMAAEDLAQRWQELLAATAELPATSPEVAATQCGHLLREWATGAASVLEPAAVTKRYLLTIRAHCLETEIIALEQGLSDAAAAARDPGEGA